MAQMKVSPGGTPSSGTFLCSTVVTTVSTYSSTLRLSKIQARLPDHVRKLVPTNSPGVTSQPILGLVARQFLGMVAQPILGMAPVREVLGFSSLPCVLSLHRPMCFFIMGSHQESLARLPASSNR